MTSVMTVLGPVPADELGITLPHEHLQCDLARVTGRREEQLSDIDLAVAEVKRFRTAGGATVVDVTNRHLGRDPVALQTISRATGLHIVMGCGWYREPFYDREVFEKTSQARAAAMSARGVNETQAAEGQLTAALTDLRAVAENYPTLRATENFQQLTRSLSELEDEIQASRRIYNSNVQSYNTTIQQFPSSIVASQGDFTAREFFEIENAAEREPVQVSFS